MYVKSNSILDDELQFVFNEPKMNSDVQFLLLLTFEGSSK